MNMMGWVLSSPKVYDMAGKAARFALRNTPFMVSNKFNPWFKEREMPEAPKHSFKEWYKKNRK
jgi:L-lactate dehydrogenase complex protein LldF